MTNEEILAKLMLREEDDEFIAEKVDLEENNNSANGMMFKMYASQWDVSEPFPIAEVKRYVRFNEWTYEDFDFENELVVQSILPDFFHDIFFKCKKFRYNRRTELSSTQVAFARMMGYKYNTQDEKAYVIYDYALQRFYNNSLLHNVEN